MKKSTFSNNKSSMSASLLKTITKPSQLLSKEFLGQILSSPLQHI